MLKWIKHRSKPHDALLREVFSSNDTHPLLLLHLNCGRVGLTLRWCAGFRSSSFLIFTSCLQVLSFGFIFPLLLFLLPVVFLLFASWNLLVLLSFGGRLSSPLHQETRGGRNGASVGRLLLQSPLGFAKYTTGTTTMDTVRHKRLKNQAAAMLFLITFKTEGINFVTWWSFWSQPCSQEQGNQPALSRWRCWQHELRWAFIWKSLR